MTEIEREGWKEAAIAWAVCASIHERFAKPGSRGKDAFYTTRQGDFKRHHEAARKLAIEKFGDMDTGEDQFL